MVGGTLPLAELARERPTVLYFQGEIDVSQAGVVTIDIAATEPLQSWLDAEPFESAKQIERQLTSGKHSLTLRIEVGARPEPEIKVEVAKPANSSAQFVVVNGM